MTESCVPIQMIAGDVGALCNVVDNHAILLDTWSNLRNSGGFENIFVKGFTRCSHFMLCQVFDVLRRLRHDGPHLPYPEIQVNFRLICRNLGLFEVNPKLQKSAIDRYLKGDDYELARCCASDDVLLEFHESYLVRMMEDGIFWKDVYEAVTRKLEEAMDILEETLRRKNAD